MVVPSSLTSTAPANEPFLASIRLHSTSFSASATKTCRLTPHPILVRLHRRACGTRYHRNDVYLNNGRRPKGRGSARGTQLRTGLSDWIWRCSYYKNALSNQHQTLLYVCRKYPRRICFTSRRTAHHIPSWMHCHCGRCAESHSELPVRTL